MKRWTLCAAALVACEGPEIQPVNEPPVAVAPLPDVEQSSLSVEWVRDIPSHFKDPDGDSLRFSVMSADATVVGAVLRGSDLQLTTFTGISVVAVEVVATDPDSATAVLTFDVTVLNRPPVVETQLPDMVLDLDDVVETDLRPYFSDPEGAEITYAAFAPPDVVDVSVEGATLTLESGQREGTTDVVVTAADAEGDTVSQAFGVEVIRRVTTWREDFDSAEVLEDWEVLNTDGSSVEVEDGYLLMRLPESSDKYVSAIAPGIADIRTGWTFTRRGGLRDDVDGYPCVTMAVHTGNPDVSEWALVTRHYDDDPYIEFVVRYDDDGEDTWKLLYQEPFDDYPGPGKDFELSMSLANDTVTIVSDSERILRFNVKTESEYSWPGGDVPETATGLRLSGVSCRESSGTMQVDWVQLKEAGT